MAFDCIVKGGIAVFPDLGERPADIAVGQGRIAAILAPESSAEARETIDARGRYVFPGLIDAHMHFGIAEKITEYGSETAYAAQGGFASVIGHFLNSAPYSEIFAAERAGGRGARLRRFRLPLRHGERGAHGGARALYRGVRRPLLQVLHQLQGRRGALSRSYRHRRRLHARADAARGPPIRRRCSRSIPRTSSWCGAIGCKFQGEGRDTLKDWSLAKPPIIEAVDTLRAMYFAEQTGCPIYFVHASCKLALDEIRRYRQRYSRTSMSRPARNTSPTPWTSTPAPSARRTRPSASGKTSRRCGRGWPTAPSTSSAPITSRASAVTKEKNIWQASQGFPGTATILPVLLERGLPQGPPQPSTHRPAPRQQRPRASSASTSARVRSSSAPTPISPSSTSHGARGARRRARLLCRLQPL